MGVAQEQHPERTRLYLQWRQFDVPVFVDALNQLPHRVVPVPMALDKNGIVRHSRLKKKQLDDFINESYPDLEIPDDHNVVPPPDPEKRKQTAERTDRHEDWRALGDAYFIRDGNRHLHESIQAYRKAIERNPENGPAQFRLGVALRRRYETDQRKKGDAQNAVARWEQALAINPNQYIWRRRLQQYGPRLDKPYNFYFWIQKARKAIRKRGETPVSLSVEPRGSEIKPPGDEKTTGDAASIPDPDPEDSVNRDRHGLVNVTTVATPPRVQPGEDVRIRVHFRLRSENKPYWNNEVEPLTISPDLPDSVSLKEGTFRHPNDREPETRGERILEFEVSVPSSSEEGNVTIPIYALYNVCEKKQGVCRYLRNDFSVQFNVDPDAPELK